MGNGLSKDQKQYLKQIQQLLKASGSHVKRRNLVNLIHIIKRYCPWFPDKGTLDLEIWEKAGQTLKSLQESGSPIGHQNLFTWEMVRTALTHLHIHNPGIKIEGERKDPCLMKAEEATCNTSGGEDLKPQFSNKEIPSLPRLPPSAPDWEETLRAQNPLIQ